MKKVFKNLGIGHCNIEGGLSSNLGKTIEINDVIFRENIDIFGINETNLKSTVDTDTLNLPQNYEFIRCDRPVSSGRGGCGVLINKNLKYRKFPINIKYTNVTKVEAIWIELTEKIYFFAFSIDQTNILLRTYF